MRRRARCDGGAVRRRAAEAAACGGGAAACARWRAAACGAAEAARARCGGGVRCGGRRAGAVATACAATACGIPAAPPLLCLSARDVEGKGRGPRLNKVECHRSRAKGTPATFDSSFPGGMMARDLCAVHKCGGFPFAA